MSVIKREPEIAIRYIGSISDETSTEAQAIKNIMVACDNDFVPPLSWREKASGAIGDQNLHAPDIRPYWLEILAQKNIVALAEDGEVVAFMSFKSKYAHPEYFPDVVKEGDGINYISTICVLSDYRRFGITRRFYEMMEENLPPSVHGECVSTRTWATNDGHIRLLEKRGYVLTYTIPEDRVLDTGEKLDTVYFCKRLASSIGQGGNYND